MHHELDFCIIESSVEMQRFLELLPFDKPVYSIKNLKKFSNDWQYFCTTIFLNKNLNNWFYQNYFTCFFLLQKWSFNRVKLLGYGSKYNAFGFTTLLYIYRAQDHSWPLPLLCRVCGSTGNVNVMYSKYQYCRIISWLNLTTFYLIRQEKGF